MRKKGKYYAVNKQEDEDGYNMYHAKAEYYRNSKSKQRISSSHNTRNTEQGSANQQYRSIILSQPMMLN